MVKQEQFNQKGGGAHRGNCCGIGSWQDIQKVKKSHTNYKYPTLTTTSSKSIDTMKCRQDWNNLSLFCQWIHLQVTSNFLVLP